MWVPPPPSQLDYEVGKARQQDVEARIEHMQELREARATTPAKKGGFWAWLRTRVGKKT